MQQRNTFNRKISFGKEVSITNRDGSKALASYISELSKIGACLPIEEEVNLFETYRHTKDENILKYIVDKNLRFVVSVAKPYAAAAKVPLEDVIQDGNIGLMKAAQLFDPTRGFRFMTFATNYVRQSILNSLAENGTIIHLPVWKQTMRSSIKKMVSDFEQREFRTPTTDEIADELGITTADIMACFSAADFVSLSSSLVGGDDDDVVLGDTMVNTTFEEPDKATDSSLTMQAVEKMFKSITWKEEYVLRRLFGVGTSEATEEEIADDMHITKERVRQLKMSAISKIQNNPNAAELADYFTLKV